MAISDMKSMGICQLYWIYVPGPAPMQLKLIAVARIDLCFYYIKTSVYLSLLLSRGSIDSDREFNHGDLMEIGKLFQRQEQDGTSTSTGRYIYQVTRDEQEYADTIYLPVIPVISAVHTLGGGTLSWAGAQMLNGLRASLLRGHPSMCCGGICGGGGK